MEAASTCAPIDTAGMVYKAVSLVLTDEGFCLPTRPAKAAQQAAEKVLEWSADRENKTTWKLFSDNLVTTLSTCFEDHVIVGKFQKQRERMWERYHKLRSSDSYRATWSKFLEALGCEAIAVFYQFVTDSLLEQLIKLRYPIMVESTDDEASLDFEECSAIRYAAGYVLRSLTKKLSRSKNKQELINCVQEMAEGADESTDSSTEWVRAVDRGGLIHVNDSTYNVFAEIELVVRKHLKRKRARDQDLHGLVDLIVSDEKVLFSWSIASVNWEEEDAEVLLTMIADHWVTMRGFSFAKSLMELYKKKNKQNIQKSKGLRKQLQKPTANHVQEDDGNP